MKSPQFACEFGDASEMAAMPQAWRRLGGKAPTTLRGPRVFVQSGIGRGTPARHLYDHPFLAFQVGLGPTARISPPPVCYATSILVGAAGLEDPLPALSGETRSHLWVGLVGRPDVCIVVVGRPDVCIVVVGCLVLEWSTQKTLATCNLQPGDEDEPRPCRPPAPCLPGPR
jgi:hypothetical protein